MSGSSYTLSLRIVMWIAATAPQPFGIRYPPSSSSSFALPKKLAEFIAKKRRTSFEICSRYGSRSSCS